MIITELTEMSASRVKVYIDEEFAFVLYKGELRKYGIKAGEPIAEELYNRLLSEVLSKRAKLRCMNLLKSRDYTREQLKGKLRTGGYPDSVAEEALAYVESFHYVDDLRYAQDFINCSSSHKSRRRIENDLQRRGISAEVILKAWESWESLGNEQDEQAQIAVLLEKKHFDRESADRKEVQRMYGFLSRKGFDSDKICRALFR